MNRGFSRLSAFLLIVAAGTHAGLAQQHPNQARGFDPGKPFQMNGIDNVNIFNGNLTVTIPIGSEYRVSSALSYGFTLVYSGNMWDSIENQPSNNLRTIVPNRRSNAGMGWLLSLGRLVPPSDPTNQSAQSLMTQVWVYESSDGADHLMYPTLQGSGVGDGTYDYTRDGTYLRMKKVSDLKRRIEFPNGTYQQFEALAAVNGTWAVATSALNATWKLTEIGDASANVVTLSYATLTGYPEIWTVTDGPRTHRVYFADPDGPNAAGPYAMVLDHIELAAAGGGSTTWSVTNALTLVTRGPGDTSNSGTSGAAVRVPLLTGVTLPSVGGTTVNYSMTRSGSPQYDTEGQTTGHLRALRLPTGAWLSWDYAYVAISGGPLFLQRDRACAVTKRYTRKGSYDDVVATWSYDRKLSAVTTCSGGGPNGTDTQISPPAQLVAAVRSPDGVTAVHYFSVRPNGSEVVRCSGEGEYEYGLAMSPDDSSSMLMDGNHLTSEIRTGAAAVDLTTGPGNWRVHDTSTLHRSQYVTYENDPGAPRGSSRVVSSSTRYDSDATCGAGANEACRTTTRNYDFDGFGHYRQSTTQSNFAQVARTTFTNFDGALDSAAHWVLGTATESCVADEPLQPSVRSAVVVNCSSLTGPLTVKTDYDRASGRLNARRTLASTDATLTERDLLATWTYTSTGDVSVENYYGGDTQPIGISAGAPFAPPALPAAPAQPPAPKYQIVHENTYTAGRLTGHRAKYAAMPFYFTDQNYDSSTGLLTTSRDSAEVSESYEYDVRQRLTWSKPTGAPYTHYSYAEATTTAGPSVVVEQFANGTTSGTALTRSESYYDQLGRVTKQKQQTPAGGFATTVTKYQSDGKVEWVTAAEAVDDPVNKTSYTYDVLGRLSTVTTPDNKTVSHGYQGVRGVARTRSIKTGTTESSVTTTEASDAYGRLISVTENSASSAAVKTSYEYDAANRLTKVCSNVASSGICGQERFFTYDGRGFLLKEQHPESGVTLHGQYDVAGVLRGSYDARGHETEIRTAAGKLSKLTFDSAERLVSVEEWSAGAYRPVKTFTFATQNLQGSPQLGKLQSAVRYNYLNAGILRTTETYEYGNAAGQPSGRVTEIARNSGGTYVPVQSFAVALGYDALQLPQTVTMPTCSLNGCSAASAALSSVSSVRTRGALTSVTGYASLTYHPSGMVNTITHMTGAARTDTYDSTQGLPRPSSIKFAGSAACTSPATPIINVASSVASGDAVTAFVASISGVTYTWEVTGATGTPNANSVTFAAPVSGSVIVKVTANSACGTATSTATVAVGCAAPTASVITINGSVADGVKLTPGGSYTAAVNSSATSYSWSLTGGAQPTSGTDASIPFTAPASGSVTLTVTAGNQCPQSTTTSVVVPVCELPAERTITLGGTVAASSSGNVAWVTAFPGEKYAWTLLGGASPTSGTVDTITFTAPPTGPITLRVVVTNSCGPRTFELDVPVTASCSAPSPATITAASYVAAGSTNEATVPELKGYTFKWTVDGGAQPVGADDQAKFTYSAPATGTFRLTVGAKRCGQTAPQWKDITVCPAVLTQAINAPDSVAAGAIGVQASVPAQTGVAAAYHWTVVGGELTSSADVREITFSAPSAGMVTLTVTISATGNCAGVGTQASVTVSRTVVAVPPAPAWVAATTGANTSVTLTWPAVPGAQSYVVERTAVRSGAGTALAPVTGTTSVVSAPASAQPVTYVYYVRSVGEGGYQSPRGAHDYATTATSLFARTVASGEEIFADDIVELRRGVDAVRQAAELAGVLSGGPLSGQEIQATDLNSIVAALDQARAAFGQPPFSYTGVSRPEVGDVIDARHVLQLREALR